MGLLVLKYTSYAILDHQAAVCLYFYKITTSLMSDDNRMFMMSLRQLYIDVDVDRRSINQYLVSI
jgi:hypothetical protein